MTALTMTTTELRERATKLVLLQRRLTVRDSVRSSVREDTLSAVRRWAKEVHKRYPAVSVYLFGSLVRADLWRGSDSDIDLAIAGMHGADYWQIWKLAEEMLPGFEIDLVDLDMATSSFREAVEGSGVKL